MHKFQCANFKCIPRYNVCNGVDNCGDGSDENNHTLCANRPRPCPNIFSDFKCFNKKCIDRSKICNLMDDCGDGSDERGCHEEGKCEDEIEGTRGGCQHRCNNLPDGGYLCLCDRGYVVDSNNPKKCLDVDECSDFGNNCSHMCSNLNGTYTCSCRDGFKLTDRFSGVCKAVEGVAKVLYSTGSDIRGDVVEQKREFDVIKNETRIEGMDFNPVTMMLYWADSQERAIKRSYIPRTDEQPLAAIGHPQVLEDFTADGGDAKPTSLSFDWIAQNLYWTEIDSRSKGSVLVAKNDGRYKRSLISSNLEEPTSVVVDPKDGLMYWTDAGSSPKIEVAWMDGSKRRTIVDTNIARPEALAIDFSMDHTIYWVDSKLNTIESMDHDGRKRHTVLSGPSLMRPVAVDIFENLLFYVSKENGALVKQDKFGRGVPVTVSKDLPNPKAVKIMHNQRYNTTIPNPCSDELNECSHLCVLIPGGRSKCKCPTGLSFMDREQKICDAGKNKMTQP